MGIHQLVEAPQDSRKFRQPLKTNVTELLEDANGNRVPNRLGQNIKVYRAHSSAALATRCK
jgi:hypothetical protein